MILGLTSDKYPVTKVYDFASTILEQKLSQIQGVGQVNVGGGAAPSVRVEVDPKKLESFGLTLSTVQGVLSLQNSHEPRGQLADGDRTADILTNDQISTAADYRPLIVGYHNGASIRLEDVAGVVDSSSNLRTAGYTDGVHSVSVIIFRQPAANIIETVDRIRTQLPYLEAALPQGIKTTIVMDRTTTIRASVYNVYRTLIGSVILVILVVFLFLRSPRATLIPVVAVPVSLIGAFAVMYLFGYSIDNLSLMALTVATGFVVDDAIVVMENITRHLEAGMEPFAAAYRGASEIGFTIFSITMSLIAVFIPILLMGGIIGRLFREFAMVLSTAILISMVISLTTTPTMCAHLLRARKEDEHQNWISRVNEKAFDSLKALYRGTLRWALDNSLLVGIVFLLTIALNILILFRIPTGFFPQQDTGVLVGGLQGPQDASFPLMDFSAQQVVGVIKADPAVAHLNAYLGQGNGGFTFVSLKPLGTSCKEAAPGCDYRQTAAPDVINRLRPKLNRLPVASVFLQAAQDLRIGGRGSNAQYQYTIQTESVPDLAHWGPILLAGMRRIPILQDVTTDQQNGGLRDMLTFDRVTAARLGQTASSLDRSLYSAFGQSQVSVIYTQLNQYYVVMEVAPQYWSNLSGLDNIYFAPGGTSGRAGLNSVTPLMGIMKPQVDTIPLQINHTRLFPSVTVSFNLATGYSLSDATREIQEMEQSLGMPASVHGSFAGTAQAYQDSFSTLWYLAITAILAVYIVLGILYESLIHPITIISTLPSASVGAMLALMLFKIDLNMISMIGIILLIGIVKKNGIMMVDFALMAERNEGLSTRESIFQACMLRFRPILMTTSAAIMGALPLAFGGGTGSELRRPLGITIVGGLILSQILTLYTTPVIYLAMDWVRQWLQRTFGRTPNPLTPQAAKAAS
jgi:multidrug efflux pump